MLRSRAATTEPRHRLLADREARGGRMEVLTVGLGGEKKPRRSSGPRSNNVHSSIVQVGETRGILPSQSRGVTGHDVDFEGSDH